MPVRSPASDWRSSPLLWPVAALALLLLLNLLLSPRFFQLEIKDGHLYGSLVDVLQRAAPILLTSLGMTLVIATGGIDLSVGAVVAITGSTLALLVERPGLAPPAVLVLALLVSLAAGAWNGALIAWAGVQPIVATLVLMVAGRGIAQLLTQGQILTFDVPLLNAIGGGHALGLPISVVLTAAAFLAVALLVSLTALRLFIESVGCNETASRVAGVNVSAIKLFVYAAGGLCAGLAGVITAAEIKAADANNAGLYLELDAILAVVIGGTSLAGGRFSLTGTLIGGLLIQTLTTTILTRGVPVEYTLVIKALAVLAVCLLQSQPVRRLLVRGSTP